VSQPIEYRWRGPLTDAEMVALVTAHGGRAAPGWWDQIRPHSLGWVTARQPDGALAGFVNVAWDGGDHAFLLDTKVATGNQRQGIATALVGHAVRHAKAAGCEWLHVDFEEYLAGFYFDACGFRPTAAGLIHLATHRHDRDPRIDLTSGHEPLHSHLRHSHADRSRTHKVHPNPAHHDAKPQLTPIGKPSAAHQR
jgi:ribosomal protein S18 acetylase RimI-like enzyme